MRRRITGCLTLVALAAIGIGAATAASGDTDSSGPPTGPPQAPSTRRTAAVERRDLVQSYETEGAIGYGSTTTIGGGSGTVTSLPAVGSVIVAGQPLYEIDGAAGPILMEGARPMWRELRNGVDDGPDIEQLERNLVALGFASADEITPDGHFDRATADAVRRMEESLGHEDNGRVEIGQVIFGPSEVRVARHEIKIGQPATGAVLAVTSTVRIVEVALDARRADLAEPGDTVELTFVDESSQNGTVYTVADVAETAESVGGNDSPPTVTVIVALSNSVDVPDLSPVSVEFVEEVAVGQLAVPVEAIVAVADGTFAVERIDATGTSSTIAVELGRFADGWVAITGDIAERDQVVTA